MEKQRKIKGFVLKIKSIWAPFLSFFKKDKSPRKAKIKRHSKMWALISIQYRDKVDTSWTYSFKTILQKVVFSVLKFAIIFGVVFGILKFVSWMFIISLELLNMFLIFLGFYVILNLISVTVGLVKSLYLAEDNKVLSSYPTTSGKLFLSKIVVFELFEIKKSLDILLPITLGFLLACVTIGVLPVFAMVWVIFPLLLIITITVLFGALLSIPTLFVYKFLKKYTFVEIILLISAIVLVVLGLVYLINQIPEGENSINVNQSYGSIKAILHNFAVIFGKVVYPVSFAYRSIVGEQTVSYAYSFQPITFGRFGIMVLVAGALFALVYFIIKPFYFSMMTKVFEFDKKTKRHKKDRKIEKHLAIVLKEFKLTFRNFGISGSYIGVYIASPIMLFLMNKIFAAMAKNLLGNVMVSMFNVILISLPILASSTVVSTIFSREGRTAYLKKTKPIKPYFLLTAKFLFNLIFVIPSIVASCIIFIKFSEVDLICGVLLGFIILLLEYGHIFFSASLDIMNPQNEVYATEGSSIANPNERKSTALSLIVSLLMGALGILFCIQSKITVAFIKLLVIALVFAVSNIVLFYLNIRAFYIDRQEASK